jgi:hypothetical protein
VAVSDEQQPVVPLPKQAHWQRVRWLREQALVSVPALTGGVAETGAAAGTVAPAVCGT